MDLNPLTPIEPKPEPATPPAAPSAQGDASVQSGAGHIDMSKIKLPQKEVEKVQSAQRINAGVLLEQETLAGVEGAPKPTPPATKPAVAAPAPVPLAPKKVEEESSVKKLQTYQSDIEHVVEHDKVSVLTIATAEAERRGNHQINAEPQGAPADTKSIVRKALMILGGVVFIAAAAGAGAYIFLRPTSVAVNVAQAPQSPFILVDDTKEITILPGEQRSGLMAKLNAARESTALSLGLMSRLLITQASSTSSEAVPTILSAQDFLSLISPQIPPDLLRTIRPTYLLGVHVYNNNQAFLIFHVDSYEQAYSGMLAWEEYLDKDLMPLFTYTPRVRIPEENVTTSTPALSFQQTTFADKIVENHDSRVIQNTNGDINLLWTFLDRNTLVIATNEATLREIISRLKNSPITPIPGQ